MTVPSFSLGEAWATRDTLAARAKLLYEIRERGK